MDQTGSELRTVRDFYRVGDDCLDSIQLKQVLGQVGVLTVSQERSCSSELKV